MKRMKKKCESCDLRESVGNLPAPLVRSNFTGCKSVLKEGGEKMKNEKVGKCRSSELGVRSSEIKETPNTITPEADHLSAETARPPQ